MRLMVKASPRPPVSAIFLRKTAERTLRTIRNADYERHSEMSLVFAGIEGVRRLNRRWLGRNRPTDVLAFPLLEGKPFPTVPRGVIHLGDVVICTPIAKRQARVYNRSFRKEVALLLVHGILHLLGFDHVTKAQEKRMFKLQEKILRESTD